MSFTFPSFSGAGLSLSHMVLVRKLSLESVCGGFLVSAPAAGSTSRDRGRQLDAQVLFTAAWGRKQADVNEG